MRWAWIFMIMKMEMTCFKVPEELQAMAASSARGGIRTISVSFVSVSAHCRHKRHICHTHAHTKRNPYFYIPHICKWTYTLWIQRHTYKLCTHANTFTNAHSDTQKLYLRSHNGINRMHTCTCMCKPTHFPKRVKDIRSTKRTKRLSLNIIKK